MICQGIQNSSQQMPYKSTLFAVVGMISFRNYHEENQKTNNSLPKTLSENEKNVLKIVETPVTKNELVSLLGISISDANVLITSMELKGLLSEKLGKIYTNSI